MTSLISTGLPLIVFISHLLLAGILVSLVYKDSWGKGIFRFLGRHSVVIAFLISLGVVLGSLFYSQVIGFEPCVLCWWQRTMLYPIAVILAVALYKKDKRVFMYVIPLAVISLVIALYQSYASLGGVSLLPCTAVGGACAKVYVKAFGYITIPVMSLTASVYLLLLAWINKKYTDENSHA